MADFDKAKPAGGDKIRLSDNMIRANNDALEDAIGRDHKFPTGDGVDSGEHKKITFNAQIANPDPGADKGALFIKDVGVKAELHYEDEDDHVIQLTSIGALAGGFPSGTKMYFYQNVAPTDWTIDAACVDALLAVKGGANAYNVNGGNQAGTWTQPNHTHTGPSHTHTGPSHTHTMQNHTHTGGNHALAVNEMPAHDHGGATGSDGAHSHQFRHHTAVGASTGYPVISMVQTSYNTTHPINKPIVAVGTHTHTVTAQGGGAVHTHGATGVPSNNTTVAGGTGATGADGTGATGGSATANTYRELAQVGIIATKD